MANANSIQERDLNMNELIVSKFDANRSINWAMHDMVELLYKEGIDIEKINKEAFISYWITKSFRNFAYGGYATFIHELRCNYEIESQIETILKEMRATKHLVYLQKQKKLFSTLKESEKEQFKREHSGYIDKNLFKKVKGKEFKNISKEENLEKLHNQWLKSSAWIKVGSFDEKYSRLSKIIGRDIMSLSKKDKEIYTFLTKREVNKKLFDIERLFSVAIYGEIEKFYWKEWAPDATEPETIKDEFYSFAVDGAGGYYLLWYYEGLNKDAPVIYFSSEGERKFLASSFSEYVSIFPSAFEDKSIDDLIEALINGKTDEYELGYIFDEYLEENTLNLTEKEMEKMLLVEIDEYIKLAKKKFPYKKYKIDEKEKFNILMKKLDGNPSVVDTINAYIEIYKRLTHTGE